MHEIFERQRVVNEYRSMDDGERHMILLQSEQYKIDPGINQHIIQMIDTDIFWYGKTFRAILMEFWKIQNGETIVQSSKELSEEEIHYCDESHAMINDPRLIKGGKHNKVMKLQKKSVMQAKHRKTGPENVSRSTKMKPTNQL